MSLKQDIFPVLIDNGRGAQAMARELFSAYRIHSLILSPKAKKRKKRCYATVLPVKEEILPLALKELAKEHPFGDALLLFPGSLRGAELFLANKEQSLLRYLPCCELERVPPPPDKVADCRFLTAYRKRDGGVLYSVGGRVLKEEKSAPLPAAFTVFSWDITESEVLRAARAAFGDDFFGFFTCFDTEEGLRFLPYLADGGKLFSLSGISPSEALLKDVVFCEPSDDAAVLDASLLPKGDVRIFRMPRFPREGNRS